MPKKKPFNPFYVLLVLVGIAFVVTACGYGVMTVRMIQPAEQTPSDQFFDTYGVPLMFGQVVILGILTFAAMATDSFWTRKAEAKPADESETPGEKT